MFEVINDIGTNTDLSYTIEYDKERGMYRVSLFKNCHYIDDIIFDEYDKYGLEEDNL